MFSMWFLYIQLFNKMSREKSRVCIQWFCFNFCYTFSSTNNCNILGSARLGDQVAGLLPPQYESAIDLFPSASLETGSLMSPVYNWGRYSQICNTLPSEPRQAY